MAIDIVLGDWQTRIDVVGATTLSVEGGAAEEEPEEEGEEGAAKVMLPCLPMAFCTRKAILGHGSIPLAAMELFHRKIFKAADFCSDFSTFGFSVRL